MEKVAALCRRRGTGITDALRDAGVSRNAFYTLARREAVVPESLLQLAAHLGVPTSALLDDVPAPAERMKHLAREAARIARTHSGVDADNVRHTLLLLEEKPIERLRRALRRGRPVDLR